MTQLLIFQNIKHTPILKPQIDEVEISDLDKRRILKAIDQEMTLKGLTKSETPDLLISLIQKLKKKSTSIISTIGMGLGMESLVLGSQLQ